MKSSTRFFPIAAMCVVIAAVSIGAGTLTRTSFSLTKNGTADSNFTTSGTGIALGTGYSTTIKLFGDILPGTSDNTCYPDVYFKGKDTVDIFFIDTTAVPRQVKTQRIMFGAAGDATYSLPSKAFDLINTVKGMYLHVDKGSTGYLASYIQDAGYQNIVTMNNSAQWLQTDSSGADERRWVTSAQCRLDQDTFLVMTVVDTQIVTIHKVYSSGSTLMKTDSVIAVAGTPLAIVNGTIAADSSGDMIAVYTYGRFYNFKSFKYQFFDRDLTPGPVGSQSFTFGDGAYYYYDDVSVVAYGRGKFALVNWDMTGVFLHLISRSGNSVTDNTMQVITKAGVKYCTVAASNRYLVLATIGDVDNNGRRCVEGIRYQLVNGVPDSAKSFSFSDPSLPIVTRDSSYSSAMNAAVDDSGMMAFVWRDQYKVAGCVWAHRDIKYANAFYRSPVDSLRFDNDSIRFKPLTVSVSSTQSWNTTAYLRTGPTVAACTTAAWFSFTDTTVLSQHRTTDCYYQTKLYLNRFTTGVIDSFTSPTITSYTVSWNVRPRFTGIDSIRTSRYFTAPYSAGATAEMISRRDSVKVYFAVHDTDNGDAVTVASSRSASPASQNLGSGPNIHGGLTIHPFDRSDTVYLCTLTVRDQSNWYGTPSVIRCRTVNSPPQLTLFWKQKYGLTGVTDSLQLTRDTTCIVQQEDTVSLYYSVADSNDAGTVTAKVRIVDGSDTSFQGVVGTGDRGIYSIAADTLLPVDTVRRRVLGTDIDTVTGMTVNMIVNHPPVIAGIVYGGDTLKNGDTTGVVIDDSTYFKIIVHDTDCAFGDTLLYSLTLPSSADSGRSTAVIHTLEFMPDKGDTVCMIRVHDRFNRADSCVLHLTYPWFETGTAANPGYIPALAYCADSVSLIDGSRIGDTVAIPVLNTGRDPLIISAIVFSDSAAGWYFVKLINAGDTITVGPADSGLASPISVAPGAAMHCNVHFSAQQLSGDSIALDTVLLVTNDPRHRRVPLPVRLEFNDLPRILSIAPYFVAGTPYRALAKKKQYVFPPHAKISVSFSEPMDTASAAAAVTLYSIKDREFTGVMQPLPVAFTWLQNNTVLQISPAYAATSPRFRLKPPVGLFIPTDSVAVRVGDGLVDVATTPSGPNRLDVDLDLKRQSGKDTTVTQKIDSIMFTVAGMTPEPGNRTFARDGTIRLEFSAPFYASTVDTSLDDNRSFSVVSTYNGGSPLRFSAISIDSAAVTFTLNRELFYRDSLDCSYHSRWIRDSLGYATDNNRDGIDISIFDSLSHDDDLQWGYRVRPVGVLSTEPESASVLAEVSPKVIVHFDGKVPAGVIDTDTSKSNLSFRIGSGRTGYSSLRSIAYLPDSTGFVIQPKLTFFSNDSVYCSFTGFTDRYRYASVGNLPVDSGNTFGGYSWFFRSGEIGFYTYPNPYKPGSDPRHCGREGPCGIWFKNLHTLGKDLSEVSIAVYSMNAVLLFDTKKQGIRITFNDKGTDNLPQWKWDTRNAHGDLVASGLYLYAVSAADGHVLVKGKLLIAR